MAIAAFVVLPATAAVGAPNNSPSTAVPVAAGTPFTGNWPGTVLAHGSHYNHWWLLPATLRAGDVVQLAVDNTGSQGESVGFCLLPPVDDFGASDALGTCSDDSYVSGGAQDRLQITYGGASGNAFLVALAYCCYSGTDRGRYTATVERIVSKVNLGLVVPALIPATFTVAAPMVYGDNTPVSDGVGARLEWRFQPPRGRQASPFAPLADVYSVGGAATFTSTLPPDVQGRAVQLRACVSQPGGDTAICTAEQNTVVQAGPDPACEGAKALRARRTQAVAKLKGKVRAAKMRRGKRKAKRKLQAGKRRLAAAKVGVRAYC